MYVIFNLWKFLLANRTNDLQQLLLATLPTLAVPLPACLSPQQEYVLL